MTRKRKFFDRFNEKTKKIAGLVSAIMVIIGALTGALGWVNTQLQDVIAGQMADLKNTVQQSDDRQNQQITRLELMELMNNQPENVAEIEKVARHYFQELNGDWYMTGLYSKWCHEYGGDPSIAAGVK